MTGLQYIISYVYSGVLVKLKYLIGIDAGTTSFKGAVFNQNGEMLATENIGYELIISQDSIVELEPDKYKDVLRRLLKILFEKTGIKPDDVAGMSIDSQAETLIFVDRFGKSLRNAIVWLDNRAIQEADEIKEVFGRERVYKTTGQPEIAATWPACKILWLKKNQPDIFEKVKKFLLLEDYLIYSLTGRYATEKSLLTSTIYFNIISGTWWKDMLDYIGVDESCLPPVYNSGVAVGNVNEYGAKQFGLSKNTVIVTGAIDQLAGMIGGGISGKNMVSETTGTCMAVCVPANDMPEYRHSGNVPYHAGAIEGEYYQIYWSQTAGAVLEWFKNNFYHDLNDRKDIYKIIDKDAAGVQPGSNGLILLPHLSGVAFPDFNANAKGVFYGVKLIHERKHFSRAIMESVSYMLREHLEAAEGNGVVFDEIRSLGGATNSRLWNQMKADITGKRIVTLKNKESTCLGAAILAGVGVGIFENIDMAVKKLVVCDQEFEPDNETYQKYIKGYEAYIEIYKNLRRIFLKY